MILRCRPGRVFLDAAGDDPERPIWKRPLQLEGLVWRGRHPGLDFVRRRQDYRHCLRVDGADLGVRLRCEERVEVVGGLAFLDLPDGRPVGPDAGEAGEGAALIESEPDVTTFCLVELAEAVERHHATVLGSYPRFRQRAGGAGDHSNEGQHPSSSWRPVRCWQVLSSRR
jgi:hypothetical protein